MGSGCGGAETELPRRVRKGGSRIGSGQREPGGQRGASAPCRVASKASSLGYLSYHGNTWTVTGARLVTSPSHSSVKRLWQVWA